MAGNLVVGTINSANITDGTTTLSTTNLISGSCKAWVNFNGLITSGESRRASFNVSSVVRNSTGDYYVNFTNPLPDTNGVLAMSGGQYSVSQYNYPVQGPNGIFNSVSQAWVWTGSDSTGRADWAQVYVTVFR